MKENSFTINPEVNSAQEFIEISQDFSNSLDLVREAISNGIWVCKDFMPIKRVNEWITSKGTEYTKLHAFINCQGLRLTANRGSFENTPSEIQQDLREAVREIYDGIIKSVD